MTIKNEIRARDNLTKAHLNKRERESLAGTRDARRASSRLFAAIISLLVLGACAPEVTFVIRMRDTSPARSKPTFIWGRISPASVAAADASMQNSSYFSNVPVGSQWAEDWVSMSGDGDPEFLNATAYVLAGWIELDGIDAACSAIDLDQCRPSRGDVEFERQAAKARPTVFILDFK
jgi:hypothetical protein